MTKNLYLSPNADNAKREAHAAYVAASAEFDKNYTSVTGAAYRSAELAWCKVLLAEDKIRRSHIYTTNGEARNPDDFAEPYTDVDVKSALSSPSMEAKMSELETVGEALADEVLRLFNGGLVQDDGWVWLRSILRQYSSKWHSDGRQTWVTHYWLTSPTNQPEDEFDMSSYEALRFLAQGGEP